MEKRSQGTGEKSEQFQEHKADRAPPGGGCLSSGLSNEPESSHLQSGVMLISLLVAYSR